MKELWEMDHYRADFNMLVNVDIVEYDLKSANTSIAREYDLLPEKQCDKLDALPKKQREIKVGLLKQKDPIYAEKEKLGFIAAREAFFRKNEINDTDVIAIKRDAIFIKRYLPHEQVGEHLLFRVKNEYCGYLNLNPVEVYQRRDRTLYTSGINDDVYKSSHAYWFGDFLSMVLSTKANSGRDNALNYIRRFYDEYKWFKLDPEYYREFNASSRYAYKDGTYSGIEYREDLSELDISYNQRIICKLVNYLL